MGPQRIAGGDPAAAEGGDAVAMAKRVTVGVLLRRATEAIEGAGVAGSGVGARVELGHDGGAAATARACPTRSTASAVAALAPGTAASSAAVACCCTACATGAARAAGAFTANPGGSGHARARLTAGARPRIVQAIALGAATSEAGGNAQ